MKLTFSKPTLKLRISQKLPLFIVGVQQAAGETGQAANQVLEASGHMFWK